jgi:hypothetical protein
MSTVPAVIAALVALGEATLDIDEWQVIDGPLESVTTARPRLLLVGDEDIVSDTQFNNLAASETDDRYTVPLLVSVGLPGADSLAIARTEAMDTYEAIRDAVLNAPGRNLGLSAQGVLEAVVTGERRVTPYARPEGRACDVRFFVNIWAQLI